MNDHFKKLVAEAQAQRPHFGVIACARCGHSMPVGSGLVWNNPWQSMVDIVKDYLALPDACPGCGTAIYEGGEQQRMDHAANMIRYMHTVSQVGISAANSGGDPDFAIRDFMANSGIPQSTMIPDTNRSVAPHAIHEGSNTKQ